VRLDPPPSTPQRWRDFPDEEFPSLDETLPDLLTPRFSPPPLPCYQLLNLDPRKQSLPFFSRILRDFPRLSESLAVPSSVGVQFPPPMPYLGRNPPTLYEHIHKLVPDPVTVCEAEFPCSTAASRPSIASPSSLGLIDDFSTTLLSILILLRFCCFDRYCDKIHHVCNSPVRGFCDLCGSVCLVRFTRGR